MKDLTVLIGLDFNLHEIFAIVFYCQRFSKFKLGHSGFFGFELLGVVLCFIRFIYEV